MSNNTQNAGKHVLTVGQGAALRVLVGINLGVISKLCEKDATDLLKGGQVEKSHIGNLLSQAQISLNTIIERKLVAAAQKEAALLIEHYNLENVA